MVPLAAAITVAMATVTAGLGDGVAVFEREGDAVPLGDGVVAAPAGCVAKGLADGAGVRDGDAVRLGDGDGVALAVGVAVLVGDEVAVGWSDGVALGIGVGDMVAVANAATDSGALYNVPPDAASSESDGTIA
jgi:hypothetical protein